MAISKPVIEFNSSGDTLKDYLSLSVAISPPDNIKFKLEKLVIISPQDARLSYIASNPETNKPEPSKWVKELPINYLTSSTGVFLSAPRGSKVDISVHVCLKSDVKVKIRIPITSSMHD